MFLSSKIWTLSKKFQFFWRRWSFWRRWFFWRSYWCWFIVITWDILCTLSIFEHWWKRGSVRRSYQATCWGILRTLEVCMCFIERIAVLSHAALYSWEKHLQWWAENVLYTAFLGNLPAGNEFHKPHLRSSLLYLKISSLLYIQMRVFWRQFLINQRHLLWYTWPSWSISCQSYLYAPLLLPQLIPHPHSLTMWGIKQTYTTNISNIPKCSK